LSSPGVRSPSVTVRLPQGLNAKLDHEAARTGKRRSEIVREALEAALA
ncbi:MAG TPA: CopG family transcriptional regulator, partial [Cutibacterium acnes]|nr:CopG family transcriptional regulator [Cutibacterium acnes]